MARINRQISVRFSKENEELFQFLKARKNTNAYILKQLKRDESYLKWLIKKKLEPQETIKKSTEIALKSSNEALGIQNTQELKNAIKSHYRQFKERKDKEAYHAFMRAKTELMKIIGEQETEEFCLEVGVK